MSINCMRSLIERANRKTPTSIAVIDSKQQLTYNELFTKVNQVAHYLSELELSKGSRIGIYSYKNAEQVIAILAIMSTDYIFVPISRLLKPEQVEHIINDCGITCIITDKAKLKNIDEVNYNGTIITYEATNREIVSFEEIYKCCTKKYECNIGGHSNATITYSFGSSGFPKGIVITHRNLVDSARVASQYLEIQSDDVISGILPFTFDYGLNQICSAIYKRATLAVHSMLLASDFFNHVLNDKVTIIPLMPIHITQMFDDTSMRVPNPQLLANVRKITSSGGKITDKMIKDIDAHYPNAQFYSMHGLTEAFRSTYLDPSQLKIRPESIGKPIPDVEIYIVNENGEECKPREIGELVHRGGYIYKGYWNAKEQTDKLYKSIKVLEKVVNLEGDLTDEIVVCSGDYVYKDEEGYIYFVSRKDDMIKSCGFRISPYEIERVVYNNLPFVKECAVFSVENEKIEEEIIMAYSASKEVAKNEILFELKKHLPNHMIPVTILYKQKLPQTSPSSGKIDKEVLKKEVLEVV
ncbi:AMP-binding protein [Sulfurospirillum arcachonense]|uniref:AMP-binding protein n=1 Tax=Sulfurospirillum arcachonense TaxID=57666 RepID=UPI000469ADB8|nr:AMP-binding protein [Sulfurospirillum arcachonense]